MPVIDIKDEKRKRTELPAVLSAEQILVGIREGRADCFEQLFNDCYKNLCHYAFTILRDGDEAEDVVQAMFVKLWERREQLEINGTVHSYLYKAVYNQCMNIIENRQVKKRHCSFTEYNERNSIQRPEVFTEEVDARIREAIARLPKQCGLIFRMSRYEELRYNEIAKALGLSINTVENQISKALRILRDDLRRMGIL